MAKLGTEKKPAIVRVQNEHRGEEIASIFDKNGWEFIIGIEPDKPEDISDLEKLLNPPKMRIYIVNTLLYINFMLTEYEFQGIKFEWDSP